MSASASSGGGGGDAGGSGGGAGGGGLMATLLEKCRELDQLRKDQDEVLQEINRLHKKIQNASPEIGEKSIDNFLLKLKTAKELAETEVSVSAVVSNMLDSMLQSGASTAQRKKLDANEQKKKRMKYDGEGTRFPSGVSIRSQLEQAASLKGEQVAARVSSDDAEKDRWLVVKVIHFDKDAKEFELLDEEPGEDEESEQKRYKLHMSRIIAFPKKTDPSSAPEFPQLRPVLAVYPGTTELYKATVVNSHRKRKSDDYLLEFDDDEEDGKLPQRFVPFYRVVPLPEGHRQ